MNDDLAITELVELFALSLGVAKAEQVVRQAAQKNGVRGARLSFDDALTLLDVLAREPGIIGITSRLAASRLKRKSSASNARRDNPSVPPPPSSQNDASPPSSLTPLERLIDSLSGTLGRQKAREEVEAARIALGLSLPLQVNDCIMVLEQLGTGTGVVSTTARFVKVRFLLNSGKR